MADGRRKTLTAALRTFALVAGVGLLAPACRRGPDKAVAPQLETAAAVPLGRCGGVANYGWADRWPPVTNGIEYALAALQDRAFLFGGYTGTDAVNVTCEWSRAPSPNSRWLWRDPFPQPSPPPEGPSPRAGHAMATLGSAIFVFGGFGDGGRYLDETWRFDGAAWSPVPVPVSGRRPSGRVGAALVSVGDRLVLFGGRNKDRALGDTWTFDGTAWTEVTPAAGEATPEARWGTGMARLGSAAVLYGGVDATGRVLEDTWTFDERWQPKATVHRPGPLHGHAMSSAGDRVVLVGGANALPASAASAHPVTWVFDGHDWSRHGLSPHPPPRIGGVMAPFGNGALLFGGGGLRLDGFLLDTWFFDGAAWQPLLHDIAPTSNVLALAGGNARVTSKGPVVSRCARGPLTAEAQVYLRGGGLEKAQLKIRAGRKVALGVSAGAWPGDDQLHVTVWCETLQSADGKYLHVSEAVVPPSAFTDRWHHLACSTGPDERPILSLDGAPKGTTPLRVSYESPPPDVFAVETWDTPLAQVDELRLSRGVRYRPPFPRPPPGLRLLHDEDTCELWHFDEASGVPLFRATVERTDELRAADGKRAFATVPAWPWPMTRQ